MRAAPVAIIRPMIGATEAASRALLGVTNAMDPEQKRRVEDKYKKY
jgi:autophagy-related protein 2